MHSDPSGFFAIPLAISLSGIVGCVILVVCLVVAAGSAIDKGNNTHVVSNAVKAAVEGIRDFTDNVKDFICAMVESLVVKKHYDDREKHHIVAKSDKRAGVSREILALVGIDINDEENLVSVKKEYHRVLHTNAYYLILNTGMVASYKFKGKEGVLQLLNFYKAALGGLS